MTYRSKKCCLSVFAISLLQGSYAQTAEEREAYPLWTVEADRFDYMWEPYTLETEEGWFLTIFRITGVKGEKLYLKEENKDKLPVLVQHGAFDAAFGWLGYNPFTPTIPGLLAERGYDVWVANTRGSPYSNTNRRDGEWSLKERWDHDWSDYATYDTPVMVDKMLEVTQKPKITIVAYSLGSAQIWYALAKDQDYYAERVARYVSLASCIWLVKQYTTYEEEIQRFKTYEALGVYNAGEGEGSSENVPICDYFEGKIDCTFSSVTGWGQSIKTFMYGAQLYTEQRFQEPQSFEKWAAGERITPLVPLSNIDRVPVSVVLALEDTLCDVAGGEYTYHQVASQDKHMRFEIGSHLGFNYRSWDMFMNRMTETIETGTVVDGGAFLTSASQIMSSLTLVASMAALF